MATRKSREIILHSFNLAFTDLYFTYKRDVPGVKSTDSEKDQAVDFVEPGSNTLTGGGSGCNM